jgi:biopolymer transport protein ExbD
MSKFNRKKKGDTPAVSTASLPDIVFMLLFFFMVATVMRDETPLTENDLPFANQIERLEKKNLMVNIFVGKAKSDRFGNQDVIQLDDKIVNSVARVQTFVNDARNALPETDQPKMMVNLKVDENSEMGVLTDVKQELRKADALKIIYAARQGDVSRNIR